MTAFDGQARDRGHRGRPAHRGASLNGALAAVLDRGAYEEAALRLLLGVVRGIEAVGDLAPDAREELLSLLALDGDDTPSHRRAMTPCLSRPRRTQGAQGAQRDVAEVRTRVAALFLAVLGAGVLELVGRLVAR